MSVSHSPSLSAECKFHHSPAQVAPTIHLPVEMRHPLVEDPEMTLTNTFPAGAVEVEPGAEVVEVDDPPPVLGTYLMPVLQSRGSDMFSKVRERAIRCSRRASPVKKSELGR